MGDREDLAKKLELILKEECRLQVEYLDLLEQERKSITAFSAEKVTELSQRREKICEAVTARRDERYVIMRSLDRSGSVRLRDLIKQTFSPPEVQRLLPVAEKLKSLLESSRAKSSEFRQLVDFGLRMVSGTLSLFWSATQQVTRSYDPKGQMKESAQPGNSRVGGVLKQA